MTNEAHSGSRWEPEQRRDETAAMPAAQPPMTWTAPPAMPGSPSPEPMKKRPLAALTAAGLVLIGGAGGWAIGSAAASGDSPAVEETGVDGTTGTQDGVPVPPGGGQLPDSDGDGRPDLGGRGGMPDADGDDGLLPPGGSTDDGSTGDPA